MFAGIPATLLKSYFKEHHSLTFCEFFSKQSMIFYLQGMDRILKCLALHSFHPWCISFEWNLQNQGLRILLRKKKMNLLRKGNLFFTRVVIKIKTFHSCRNPVVRVALVSLVSLVSRLYRTCVARVGHSCCEIG